MFGLFCPDGSAKSVILQQTVPAQMSSSRPPQRIGSASLGVGPLGGAGNYYRGDSANVSLLLESLLRGYDKRLRPNYNGIVY